MKENNENEKAVLENTENNLKASNEVLKEKTDDKVKKNKKEKKEKKIKSKISKFILILIALVIVLVIVIGIYQIITNNFNKTNLNYLESMEAYGFDVMYDNNSAEPTEVVTKSEAVKMVITSMLNESDIANIVEMTEYIEGYQDTMTEEQVMENLEYSNELWVAYAISSGVIEKGEITAQNANEPVTLLETLVYFANAKVKLLNEVLDTETTPDIKNFESYRVSEQLALSDMIYNEMIQVKENFEETLTKERLNKLLIDMVLEYNTITVEGEKININKDKEPKNADEYPYTLASVDKSVYELENYVLNDTYKNARKLYIDMKEYYSGINSIIQDYMNTILNVDYSNFDETNFTNSVLDLSYHYENTEDIKEYIEYVKSNKIKISGSAKVQYPAIYFDGEAYRVRVKVDYKIENATKKENLIYGDLKSKESIGYNDAESSIIVDVPFKKSLINELMYIEIRPLNNILAGSVKSDEESLKENVNTNVNTADVPNSDDIDYTESDIVQNGDELVVTPLE